MFGGGVLICFIACLCALQYNCLRWLRLRRLYTWSWNMPVEVSNITRVLRITGKSQTLTIILNNLTELYTVLGSFVSFFICEIVCLFWQIQSHYFIALHFSFLSYFLLHIQIHPINSSVFSVYYPFSHDHLISQLLRLCLVITLLQYLIRRHTALFSSVFFTI